MMSSCSKSSGVVVQVTVITEGEAKVGVQCFDIKDGQDMRITEGDRKGNDKPTGLKNWLYSFRNQGKEVGEEEKPVCPGDETNEEVPPIKIFEAIRRPGDENITYEEVPPVRILEVLRRHGSKTILEDEPSCPGDETNKEVPPIKILEPIRRPGDENITYEEVPSVRILEVLRRHASKTILEDEPVCPVDETNEEIPPIRVLEAIHRPGDKNITYEEVPPVRILEVLRRHGSKTILEDETNKVPPIKILEAIHHPGDENITYEEVPSVRILEVIRRHASKTILEDEPVCQGDEEPTKPSEDEKPVCPGDENITYEEVPSVRIREVLRRHGSKTILEDVPVCPGDEEPTKPSEEEKPVCTGDEEPTKPSEEEKPVCPGDENIAPPSSPVTVMEVVQNKGEVTIFKEKSKKKKWNPFKRSNKIIEKRSERQIVEYGPPEEPCKEEKPVCRGDEEPIEPSEEEKPIRGYEEFAKINEENFCPGNEEPIEPSEEEKPVCPRDEEFPKIIEENFCPGDKNMDFKPNRMKVVSLHMKSFLLSLILAVIIFVGVKVAFPEVDLQMIGGMSTIIFFFALLVQQLFSSNSCQCHVLSGEECTCHTLFGIYFGILI